MFFCTGDVSPAARPAEKAAPPTQEIYAGKFTQVMVINYLLTGSCCLLKGFQARNLMYQKGVD